MTIEFLKSQVAYYKRNLNCGPSRDWNLILGLYLHYNNLLQKAQADNA
jgi:hypothetical protein